ncbi:L-pipecolate oxidase [Wohlfahrtiimonas chitiniclastica]|uniref:L-pipecolate oxidase n=1 Tax=Wohlfahrtiimonas chitiniclastica TaxID=400946 RepID=UPI001BCE06B6|nr:FAD-binding oxidoreductase [Wohlfahrtiimonas chitiniclastica]MBS7816847.1 FAD-binding oxidoreductase [Wohlfahrtiimonas chitiniclastica]MBS7822260.1 FAD-binding oxidoreductase [Wohlfahrtiimonas chitiniclastica]MBS7830322.1 FAD-binding oxidoreductase [Wohlfahrtiimonas chitiniclastica]MBS7832290.1 FAD-binding oxidoreductase [Wohlfahrtiimonas chitiniclastica]
MTLKHENLWHTLVSDKVNFPALNQDDTADVCIVGAGFTGLSAAIHLAEKGKKVVVLDAHHVAYGGSGRNVGLVNAGTWNKPDFMVQILGKEMGESLISALGDAPKLVFSLIHKYGIDAQQQEVGTLHMAHSNQGIAEIEDRYEQLTRRSVNVELLKGERIAEYSGSQKIPAALLDHRAGTVNPYAYATGLAKAAASLGVKIYENSPVSAVNCTTPGQWSVTALNHTIKAEKVIIATNAYAEGDLATYRQSIYSGYYYQVASEPLTGDAGKTVLPYKQGSWDTRLVLSSIRLDKDGRLILGSMGKAINKPAWYLKTWADRIQQHYFPQLGKDMTWEYSWCGRIGFTDNHTPKIFEPAKGLIAAIGYNGRGITTGTLMGKLFAEHLTDTEAAPIPVPFYSAVDQSKCNYAQAKSLFIESGFTLYHLGQCLKVIR